MASPHIHAARIGLSGHLVLDRPRALNALDLPMITSLQRGLNAFLADDRVQRIIIRSSTPRAFSAGGDMRHIRERVMAEDFEAAMAFFRAEFALNLAIARCSKPYVALIQGICMGGGLGLSVHGAYRVIAEGAHLAMPETAIGYFTDVGGSYFLNRLRHCAGRWMGLTGATIGAPDAVEIGLGTHLAASEDMAAIADALSHDAAPVEAILARHQRAGRGAYLHRHAEEMERIFAAGRLDHILAALQRSDSAFARQSLEQLRERSPHALRLTFDLLERGRSADLATCLQNELAALPAALRHPDFVEGVRAVLVDKDRTPVWRSEDPGDGKLDTQASDSLGQCRAPVVH